MPGKDRFQVEFKIDPWDDFAFIRTVYSAAASVNWYALAPHVPDEATSGVRELIRADYPRASLTVMGGPSRILFIARRD